MDYIGKSFQKTDAWAKVTGQARFVADLKVPRTVHAAVLRPTVAHGLISSIDVSEAEQSPGVIRVVTGQGCEIRYGACGFVEQPPLAVDRVRHAGEAVAVVIADTESQARAALKKIHVEYQELPVFIDPVKSAENRETLIHPDLGSYSRLPCYLPVPGTNIFHHYKLRKGDVEKGFADAEHVVEAEFDFPHSAHSALEPHGVIARWDGQNRVEIWASSQAPFVLQEVIAGMYGIPHANVRVHVPYMGGGFGGKSDTTVEPLIVHAARQVPGRAVRFICSRKEVMTSTVLGRGMKGHGRLGVTKDGKITAFQARMYFAGGAYGDTSVNVITVAGHNSVGPYEVENAFVDAIGAYTNTPPVGAYRGYGHPEGCLISERLLDMMARKIGISPFELRRRNFLKDGARNSLGETIRDYNGNLFKCLDGVEKAVFQGAKPAREGWLYGRGVAAMMKSPKGAPNAGSSCYIKMCADGSIHVNLSGIDMGQGAQQAMRQIAAEALKIHPDRIAVYTGVDTQHSPWEWQTVASMFTYRGGNAVIKASARLIELLKQNATRALPCETDAMDYDGEYIFMRSDPDRKVAVSSLVRGYMLADGITAGEIAEARAGDRLPRYGEPDAETGMGPAGGTWTYGCQACELRVNPKTGQIIIDHFASALDVGRVISPQMIRGQITGGVMMGIGQTLQEKIEYSDKGIIKNATWVRYKIPNITDRPGKQTVICVETPEEGGPYGARCVAEHPMVAVAPAILNALTDATGIEFNDLPVTPDKVCEALGAAGAGDISGVKAAGAGDTSGVKAAGAGDTPDVEAGNG